MKKQTINSAASEIIKLMLGMKEEREGEKANMRRGN